MAILGPFLNGYITVNGQNYSAFCTKITVTTGRDTEDVTAMGATNKAYVLSLGDATIEAEFLQEYASGAASIDAALWALNQGSSTFVVEVRPVNTGRAVTNPAYLMTSLLPEYTPLDGKVADVAIVKTKFINGAAAGMTRVTA